MYLNVNLATNASAAGGNDSSTGAGSCTTPRTPEILNLLAGAPFDNVGSFGGARSMMGPSSGSSSYAYYQSSNPTSNLASSGGPAGLPASTPGDGPSSPGDQASSSFSSFSSLCSSPATPSTPPAGGPPSIQNTRTYLIKEGLKLTIQSKRLASGRGSLESDSLMHTPLKDELTTEDEERRRRRRERNKVAATKCRNRKKERTGILMQESDALEDQNGSFRSEIQRLEAEKRRLMDVLAMHSPTCLKTAAANQHRPSPVTSCSSDFIQQHSATSNQSLAGTRAESALSFDHQQAVVSSEQNYVMSTAGLASSNYGQIYDCSTSTESTSMTSSIVPHHHHSSNYDDPSESARYGSNSSNDMVPSFSQANMTIQRGAYTSSERDHNLPGQNYR